jgi:hypothetical protein
MIIDGILRQISPSNQARVQEAATTIDSYSPPKLAKARSLLVELARDLGGLYRERELTNRYLVQGPQVIDQLRERSYSDRLVDPEQFIHRLGETFRKFEDLVRFGHLVLYRRHELDQGREVLRLVLPATP